MEIELLIIVILGVLVMLSIPYYTPPKLLPIEGEYRSSLGRWIFGRYWWTTVLYEW